MSEKKTIWKEITFVVIAIFFVTSIFYFFPEVLSGHYVESAQKENISTTVKEPVFVPSYVETPTEVKGIYMTSWIAGTPRLRDALVKIIDETEINTVVIDIKDYSGRVVYEVKDPKLIEIGSQEIRVSDMRDFIESLHKKGIYVIGRLAVFQDAYFVKKRPDLAVKNKKGDLVWKDRKGISWIDAGSTEYWDYILHIAKESRNVGFDEINFDYIRFPSDGDMQDISYPFSSTTPKSIVLKNFFEYLHDNLKDSGLKISADLFGMVTTAQNDMGIGQILENALPNFDYIDPMVYPSHYPPTFEGFATPEAHPYEIVHYAMESAVNRAIEASTSPDKLRPWLQDFGLQMDYGPEEVKAQIKATNDVGLKSWILWSASNKYTTGALETDKP
jgi:hypothetical protein